MKILHLCASPRSIDSNAWWLSRQLVERLTRRAGAASIIVRDLYAEPLPHPDGGYADALASTTSPASSASPIPLEPESSASMPGTATLSLQLIDELEQADTIVIGTPMHNYTVPSVLKAWIDHVVRVRRTFVVTPEGKRGLLKDRPVYVGIVAGGRFSGPEARQPDFLTPYLKVALGTIGLHDLRFYSMQGVAAGATAVRSERERMCLVLDSGFSGDERYFPAENVRALPIDG